MNISPEDLAEFKEIWIRHGYEYKTDEELLEAANRLISLMRVISKPIPHSKQSDELATDSE